MNDTIAQFVILTAFVIGIYYYVKERRRKRRLQIDLQSSLDITLRNNR